MKHSKPGWATPVWWVCSWVLVAGGARAQLELLPQQGLRWCWAATTQMVIEQRTSAACSVAGCYSQARQVELQFPEKCPSVTRTTCLPGKPAFYLGCDRVGFPGFEPLGFTADVTQTPLRWGDLKTELDACGSFVFGWCAFGSCGLPPNPGSGHFLVAAAADVCRDGQKVVPMVQAYNPAPCCIGKVSWVPYVVYAKGQVATGFWVNYNHIRRIGQEGPGEAAEPTSCRRTSEVVTDEQANFVGTDGSDVASAVLRGCGWSGKGWKEAGLLDLSDLEMSSDELKVGVPLRRVVVLDRDFPAFVNNQASFLDPAKLPRVWVYPVENGGRVVGGIVVREETAGSFQLEGIDSAATMRRLFGSRRKHQDPVKQAVTEVLLPETQLSLFFRGVSFSQTGEYFGVYGDDCLPLRDPDQPWELSDLLPVVVPP
jgi:hypothetical protein